MLRIVRVFNNNALLAEADDGVRQVLMGKGVGFQTGPGQAVRDELVEQRFLPEHDGVSAVAELVATVPLDVMRVADVVCALAAERLALRRTQATLLAVADHLQFAAERARSGQGLEFPLTWEVRQIYPKEYEAAVAAVGLASHELGVPLQPDEATALAMHFVNAQFAGPGMAATVTMTEAIGQAFDVIGLSLGQQIDRSSMSAARFVTHLRYLFVRIDQHAQIDDTPSPLLAAIRETHPDAYRIAAKLGYALPMRTGDSLSADELAYLTLHVALLVADLGSGRS